MSGFNLIIKPDEDDIEAAEVYVDGRIEGKKYRFILDTGSARTSVQFNNYTSKFECIQKNNSSGVFAKITDNLIRVPYIKLGPILKKNFTLVRLPENSINIRNLIGMDILKDFCCHFYFDENRVLIDNSEEVEIRDPLHELFLGKRFHPYIKIQFEKLKVNAVWDTGAGITTVDLNFINKHPSYFQEIGQSIGTDSTGAKMETTMFTMVTTIIGNNEFPPHKVAGVDLSHINSTSEVSIDLILGYSTLCKANWLFDFPHKKWAVLKILKE
ncbi:MAG: clan AA aspartic protease [Candidatus Lokiarchaeota archaeon]|nr:clan AA aspartic protease [Candidatus Lokiarchaeota archaeon]